MAISLDEYKQLKAKADQLRERAAKAAGAYEAALAQLAEQGYPTVEAAEEGLQILQAKASEAELAYAEEFQRFRDKWGGVLDL